MAIFVIIGYYVSNIIVLWFMYGTLTLEGAIKNFFGSRFSK